MRLTQKTSGTKCNNLQTVVESLLSMRDGQNRRHFLQHFSTPDPLVMQILIHGITSSVWDDKYCTVGSSSMSSTRILKLTDFDEALVPWRASFDRMSESDRLSRTSGSALVVYHLTAITLRSSLADTQMVAGSSFSFGRTVTPQRAQEAYMRLVTNEPLSDEMYRHGLEIVSPCLQDPDAPSPKGLGGGSLGQPRPLWQAYCAFLGVLVLWAHLLTLERIKQSKQPQSQFSSSEMHIGAGTLANMFDREIGNTETNTLQVDVRRLIVTVRDFLADSSWEICESLEYSTKNLALIAFAAHEARRILTSLSERNGFGLTD